MKGKTKNMSTKRSKSIPRIVSPDEWQATRKKLLAKEKAMTRSLDALSAERRRLPMVLIDKKYVFDGPNGKVSLLDLFEGRRQLILYHFMFSPAVSGWPSAGCPGCSLVIDQIGHLAHLHARDTSFVVVSIAPLANIKKYKKRMGWTVPWYSSFGTDFNKDFGRTTVPTDKHDGEIFGLSVFFRDGKHIYRSYFTDGRGIEALGSVWSLLDVTPLGRQETWEDSPAGWPQTPPFEWWERHDEYPK
jgi:predicted dithiol-disulfide oxidoreductase (DUF899 family)